MISRALGGIVLLVFAISIGCARGGGPRPLGPDDYAVYAAVLTHFATHDRPVTSARFIIRDSTRSHGTLIPRISADEPAAWARAFGHATALKAAALDYGVQSRRDTGLERSLPVEGEYVFAGDADLDSLRRSQPDVWAAFNAHYPQARPSGLFTLSRIGFNADHSAALVYCLNEFGSLGAIGKLYFLAKEDGIWRVLFNPGGEYLS
jgi:hypothetical protein